MSGFTDDVYEKIRDGAQRSALAVAPLLVVEARRGLDSARLASPLQVLDVGCGEGWWSWSLAQSSLVKEVISIDAAQPAQPAPGVNVQRCDLTKGRLNLVGDAPAFNLTLCLEVGEHLPETAARGLVRDLCVVTDPRGVIAWSAAIPGQRGHGHVNEQWPPYWDRFFRESGWMLTDPLREQLWDDLDVEPWYAQNLLIARHGSRNRAAYEAGRTPRGLVHPVIFGARVADADYWREVALAEQQRYDELLSQAGGTSSP